MPQYAMPLNMPEHGRIFLNVAENTWTNCSDYSSFFTMLWYSYNNIIVIVTNVVILEFLSAWFIHPDALLPFYLFLTRVRI